MPLRTLGGVPAATTQANTIDRSYFVRLDIGGPWALQGIGGGASYQYVDCGSSATLRATGDQTIAAWVYQRQPNAGGTNTIAGNVVNNASGIGFYITTADLKLNVATHQAGANVVKTSTGTVPYSTWTHVAFVKSGTNVTFYINGVAAGTGTGLTNPVVATRSFVLYETDGGINLASINGMLSDVRYYNAALSASDITNIFNGAGIAPTANLQGWWKLTEGSGATVPDYSGNANTGTLTNSPVWVANAGVGSAGVQRFTDRYCGPPPQGVAVPAGVDTVARTLTANIDGSIGSTTITAAGAGITSATVVFSAAPAGGRTATGRCIIAGQTVTAIVLTDPGAGYTSNPSVTITDNGSPHATATASVQQVWSEVSLVVGPLDQSDQDPLSVSSLTFWNLDLQWTTWGNVPGLRNAPAFVWDAWFDTALGTLSGSFEMYDGKIDNQELGEVAMLALKPFSTPWAREVPWVTGMNLGAQPIAPRKDTVVQWGDFLVRTSGQYGYTGSSTP